MEMFGAEPEFLAYEAYQYPLDHLWINHTSRSGVVTY